MLSKKNLIFAFSIALMSFVLSFTAKAQDVPNDEDVPMIDSIEYNENLLDSNAAYKSQFDSLSKDGDWETVNKSDFVQDISENTGEDLSANYPATVEVIYVWRPHCYTADWNPYSNGRWVFTCDGWIWVSDYDWGWGPYNYGRWYCSNSYGWIWLPGRVWSCNWVTWRHHNNYCGWYPTCPRIYWRDSFHNRVYTNHVFAYNPRNWVFVKKNDFTKPINPQVVLATKENPAILKQSKKSTTKLYTDPKSPKIKYTGPDVVDISKETGEKITPRTIEPVNIKGKQIVTNEKVSTYRQTGSPTLSDNNTKKKAPVINNTTKDSKNPVDNGYSGTRQSGNQGSTTNPPTTNNPYTPPTKNPPTTKNPGNPPPTKNPPPPTKNPDPPTKNPPPPTKNPPPQNNTPPDKKDDGNNGTKGGSKKSIKTGSGNTGSTSYGSTGRSSRNHGTYGRSSNNGSRSHGSGNHSSRGNGSKNHGSKRSR